MRHHTPSNHTQQPASRHAPTYALSDTLELLIYELLDAHDDTARLSHELGLDTDAFVGGLSVSLGETTALRWRAHLDYLRALQRKGREALAKTSASQP